MIFKATSVVAASALLLTACASNDDSNSGKSGSSDSKKSDNRHGSENTVAAADYLKLDRDEIKDGGELTTAIGELSAQQNMFHADSTAYTRSIWSWYNPQMALFSEDGEYSPNPDYISDVKEEEKDGKTVVTFTIVDEAKFNDDTPIDWRAFETTWKINNGKDPAYSPNATDGYDLIESVTKGDTDKQAVVTFESTYPWWQGLFNDIAHPALADPANYGDYIKKVHPEWGAGPYTIESIDFDKGEASFVRNPKWWGPEGKLDKRSYRYMEDQASLNAFKNGEVDATGIASKNRYASIKDMQGIKIYTSALPHYGLTVLNGRSEILKDIEVRKAITQAIDRDQLSAIAFQGLPYEETPPGSLVIYPFQKGYEDNYSKATSFDLEAAKKTLDDAGWAEGADGIREKDGKKLHLKYVFFGDSDRAKSGATANQKMLRDAGIDLEVESRPGSEFSATMTNKDFDIVPMGFSSSDPFGIAYFKQTWYSTSELNKSGTGTPELDKEIDALQKLPTRDEQIARANEIEVKAFERYGLIPLENGPSMAATKEGLANYGAMGFSTLPIENIGWAK